MRVPYKLLIGEKEENEKKVSIRIQGKDDLGAKDLDEFLNEIVEEVKERRGE
jgi:threonyl-tRNA synthetase